MLKELENLCRCVDFLSNQDAVDIITLINQKLKAKLNAHIVDVIWKKEGRFGVILEPFASIDLTDRGGARTQDAERGIWGWVYGNGKPIWLEKIKSKDKEKPARNLVTGEDINPEWLDIFSRTDSIMAVPLIFRDAVWGVYCIELAISNKFRQEDLELVERLSRPISWIVWKSDAQNFNQQQTRNAIASFGISVSRNDFMLLDPYRSGFVARPFDRQGNFQKVQNCIVSILKKNQIRARHFTHPPGRERHVIEEIMNQIKLSHFGIADITGFNVNVMLEFGMVMVLRKKFLLFQQRTDGPKPELPFDLRSYHYHQYVIDGPEDCDIKILDPGSDESKSMEEVVNSFVEELNGDEDFANAKPWRG